MPHEHANTCLYRNRAALFAATRTHPGEEVMPPWLADSIDH